MDVVFYECFDKETRVLKKLLPGNIEAVFCHHTIQESGHAAPLAKIICIRTQSVIPVTWNDGIEGVFSRSQGFDHLLDMKINNGLKAICGALKPYCSRAVAEHAVLMMMSLMRNLKKQIRKFETFDRNDITGIECAGRNALIVGVGNIGIEIIDILKGIRMNVKGVDIIQKHKNIDYVSLKEGVKSADVVFCSANLTDDSRGLLGYEIMRYAKPGVILVNVSRGEITPAEDLKQIIEEGILGGLALDVFPNEKELAAKLRGNKELSDRSCRVLLELSKKDNVIFTPHNAFNTEEALENKAKSTVAAISQFLHNKSFPLTIS